MPDADGWPPVSVLDYATCGEVDRLAVHPADDGVLLGGIGALYDKPREVDAVVSLCRLGADEAPAHGVRPEDHVEVWLVDSPRPEENPNLEFVLDDAARTVEQLRSEGRRVLLHCVRAENRTPAVASRYTDLLGAAGSH